MNGMGISNIPQTTRLELLSKQEIIQEYTIIKDELARVIRENYQLRKQNITEEQLKFVMHEELLCLKDKVFGASSERYKKPQKEDNEKKEPPKPRIKKPSERYPNIPVTTKVIKMDPAPNCPCCGEQMQDSGMTEDTEQLTVIPRRYEIIEQKRVKYICACQGSLITAPAPARIIDGSAYSDEMIQDVALSKYCDLIPIERYAQMAARTGLKNLPPHSLIEVTHKFSDFVRVVYDSIREGVLKGRVLHADETPHRMLEGSKKKTWYLWGFSTLEFCFLECHDTRSGDIASDILINARSEVLVSDVYSGYRKGTRLANLERQKNGKKLIQNAYCNAHARRYFFQCYPQYKEAQYYLDQYHEIYQLNTRSKDKPPPIVLELRSEMGTRFEQMKQQALSELGRYPKGGKYLKALNYLLENYKGLTLFLTDTQVPIDNNSQERLLRDHVVGRKTWYGTHSKRGALTAAILFTIVETCKLNQVNPREYFDTLIKDMLAGKKHYTPVEFKKSAK